MTTVGVPLPTDTVGPQLPADLRVTLPRPAPAQTIPPVDRGAAVRPSTADVVGECSLGAIGLQPNPLDFLIDGNDLDVGFDPNLVLSMDSP